MNGLLAMGIEQLVPVSPLFQAVLAAAVGDATPLWSGETLLRSFLVGWLFWLGISLGSQALVWLHELTGGAWGRAIRVDAEAAGQTLPLLLLGLLRGRVCGMRGSAIRDRRIARPLTQREAARCRDHRQPRVATRSAVSHL